ncbi:unnamed protein product [Leuciscus chuanchicus]
MPAAVGSRVHGPHKQWILASFYQLFHFVFPQPFQQCKGTKSHRSSTVQTSLGKAAGAPYKVWWAGPVCGDTLQRSFLEFSYCAFEEDNMSCGAPFTCPACTPDMLAISVDGNRKLYRFLRNGSSDSSFFQGSFIAEDTSVSAFVDVLHKAVKQAGFKLFFNYYLPGQGRCGSSSWTAAKETSKRTFKLDEEGMEVAVCRHGFLLKALNMFRGEIFAYPMYLHKELMCSKPRFIAMDVMCKYWPYLRKSANILPDLQGLTSTRPFLSVMHATAHSTKCEITWSGKNQDGAGSTAGEEVEQVNSYLSRCALTTKYMSKGARVDMLTIQAMAWNYKKFITLHRALSARYVKTCQRLQEETASLAELKESLACTDEAVWVSDVREWAAGETTGTSLEKSIEGQYLNMRQRKQALYRQNDSGKFRHRLRRKIAESKRLLYKDIETYNSHEPAMAIDVNEVEQSLSGDNPSPTWPWEVHGSAQIEDKLKIFNKSMLKMRLEEERTILVQEMAQHCSWLQKLQATLKRKTSEEDKRNKGLSCLCRKRLSEVSDMLTEVHLQYKAVLGPQGSAIELEEENESDFSSPDTSENEEECREELPGRCL